MTKIKKEKSKDMTSFKVKNENIANIRAIFEGKQILSLDKMKTSKGITLIALVITIIVLLILAGVTIATLTGDNGILTKAQEASEKTKQANAEEQVQLAVVGSIGTDGILNLENLNKELEQIGAYYNGNPISTAGNKIEEGNLPVTVTLDGQEVTIGQSGNVAVGGKIKEYTNEGVPIPNGFYYVGGTKESGVVISDNPADEDAYKDATNGIVGTSLQGNQFVWVPVTYSEFNRYDGFWNGQYDNRFVDEYGEADEDGTNDKLAETVTTQKEAQKMYASVETNGGFYVGRYEAGKENGNVVEKQGKEVYNNVTWSRNGQMNEEDTEIVEGVDGTKDGAVELARNFDTANNYISVASTLIYGVQWDAIMAYIEPRYKDASDSEDLIAEKNFVADSTGKGNYREDANTNEWKGKVTTTGASDNYAVNNIYDLAGNVFEWTMESYGNFGRVIRGGFYGDTGSSGPASIRYYDNPSFSYGNIGFRVTLYL